MGCSLLSVDLLSELHNNKFRLMPVFSTKLRCYRHETGLSQKEFANLVGLHQTFINALECGKLSIAIE